MSSKPPDFIPIAAPDIDEDEEKAVLRVLRSGRLAQGPEVAALEEEFAQAQGSVFAIAVASGTAALHVALHVSGIGPGDEVLVPTFTFAASANAVLAVGARPVFVDIGNDFLLDLEDAESKLTGLTKGIMPVDLYGLMPDMDRMRAFASDHGLALIEDAAQAHLARRGSWRSGTAGIGAFSLYATKNMMSGEGGIVTMSDEQTARDAALFRNHGMETRYRHVSWGLNYRLSDLAAAIGRVQLEKLPNATARRRSIAGRFDAELPSFFTRAHVPADAYHVYHQYTVRVPAGVRDDTVDQFHSRGIGVDVYYPTPVHLQPSFGGADGQCPTAEQFSREVLSLPVHPKVTDDQVGRIIAAATAIASNLA